MARGAEAPDLLALTTGAAERQRSTVHADGRTRRTLPHGSEHRTSKTQIDDRGTVFEVYDSRWNFHPEPVEYVYQFSIRPGVVKGWGLHRHHDDRYVLLRGEVEVFLYDVRPDSPTCGQLSRIVLAEHNRGVLSIPAHVWHADQNIGDREAVMLNMPTRPYDHASPDKLTLPLDTPLIPHDFGDVRGG